MTTEKRDYSKLRPFDLEAAVDRGEAAIIVERDEEFGFVAGPNNLQEYVLCGNESGFIVVGESPDHATTVSSLRMAPLAWVRASADDDTLWPVYKGDVLWHSCGKCEALGFPTLEDHDLLIRADGLSQATNAKVEFLTFTPPKVKRQVKLLAYLDADQLFWLRETAQPKWPAVRVPLEDRVVEVEEPAGREGGAQ